MTESLPEPIGPDTDKDPQPDPYLDPDWDGKQNTEDDS